MTKQDLIYAGCKAVDGFPSYVVSRDGDVYSTHKRKVHLLSHGTKPGGYAFIGLYEGGRCAYRMVHRLVAAAFIDNPRGLPEVNHIDGNKKNNSVTNLEWCSRGDNARHAHAFGLMPRGPGSKSPLSFSDIFNIRTAVGRYRDIGALYGVSAQTVCNIKRGYTKPFGRNTDCFVFREGLLDPEARG